MADGIGVTERTGEGAASGASGRKPGAGDFFKQHKVAVIGGGGLALLLLMGHKGSSASGSTSPQDQLQAQSDALAAEQAALESGSVLPPGGGLAQDNGYGVGSGGATSTDPQTAAPTTDPTGSGAATPTVNVTVQAPAAPAPPGGAGSKVAGKPKPKPKSHHPKPAEPPKHTHPKPAGKHGEQKHPSHGEKVESPHGQGHGVTVHGRTFPGATGHHVGAVQHHPDGTVRHDVTVNYGGHTETHTSINHGRAWQDNTRGKNPPSRGVVRHR